MKCPKWLQLQGEIDYLYYLLDQILERHSKNIPQSGIAKMIDEATGYNKKRLTDFEKEIKPICLRINKLKEKYYKLTQPL